MLRGAKEVRRAELARTNVFAFCEHVGRDKVSRKPLELTGQHKRYIRALLHPLSPEKFGAGEYAPEEMIPDRDSDVVALGHPNSGKTELASLVGLWVLCKLLERGVWPLAIWGGETKTVAAGRAMEWVAIIERLGDQGEAFGEVFPKVGRGSKWNYKDGWFVAYDGETAPGRDATIRAFGIDTGIHGSRYHIGIFDDVQTADNQRSQTRRAEVYDKFVRKIEDRRDERSWSWFLSNAWFEDSPDAKLVAHGWREFVLKVANAVNVDDFRRKLASGTARLYATFRWKLPAIRRVIDGPAGRLPYEADRKLFCVRMPAGLANRYKRELIEDCFRHGLRLVPSITRDQIPTGARIYTGVDIGGLKKKNANDPSCFFTIMVYGENNRRRILNIETGRWDKAELDKKAREIHRRYHVTRNESGQVIARHGEFIVEDNAAQAYIAQSLSGDELPVRAFTTGRNKHDEDYGVDAMAGEFAIGRWEIPCDPSGTLDPEVDDWITEMCRYSPENHTGDRHMASWIATMGAIEDHEYTAGHADDDPPERAAELRRRAILHNQAAPDAADSAAAEHLWDEIREGMGADDWQDDDGYGVG